MHSFQFPIRKADGSQFQDAEHLHRLLESEESGFYLLGKNQLWHGGVHISDTSAPHCIYNEPVRCIAEGEVVAYRLNRDYLTSQVGPDTPPLKYSSSFCLVRHKYQSPANPEEGPNHGKQNELTFYSLYMHLLPYERYPDPDPAYDKRVEIGFSGRAARNLPMGEPGSQKLGELSAGVHLDILDEREGAEGYRFCKGRIVGGRMGAFEKGAEVWFASHKDGRPIRPTKYNVELLDKVKPPDRTRPTYWRGIVTAQVGEFDGLSMYQPPKDNYFGALYDANERFPRDYSLSFDNEQTCLFCPTGGETRPIAACTSGSETIWGQPIRQEFWTFVDSMALKNVRVEPARLDTIIIPSTPIPIQAGDPVGYLGLYELPADTGKKSRHQVHLEVFTCDPQLDAFLDNQAGLKQGKQYLHVPKLQTSVVGRDPHTDASSYLFQDHVFDLKKLTIVKDQSGVDCYKISVQEKGLAQGAPLRNLDALISKQAVAEGNGARIVSQHELSAIGFNKVEQHLQNSCSPQNDENVCQFYRQLHALADINNDGEITPDELRATLRNPEFRDRWSKLIVLHHTEWQSNSGASKWQPLRDRLRDSPELWRHESERIDNLVFWDEVAKTVGLPADGRVWHFHPVEFIRALNDDFIDEDSLDWLTVPNGQLTFDVEGNDIHDPNSPLHTYFSRKVHWPGGVSGITIGRGYDLGQRPNPEDDFAMVGISEPLLSWLLGAKGLQGQAAKNHLTGASDEIRRATISRRQQYDLFVPIYEYMKKEIIRISGKTDTVELYGRLDWNLTHEKIREVVVDLMYRGDYGSHTRGFLQRHITGNDLARFSEAISDSTRWTNVPSDRFNKRVQYLRQSHEQTNFWPCISAPFCIYAGERCQL